LNLRPLDEIGAPATTTESDRKLPIRSMWWGIRPRFLSQDTRPVPSRTGPIWTLNGPWPNPGAGAVSDSCTSPPPVSPPPVGQLLKIWSVGIVAVVSIW